MWRMLLGASCTSSDHRSLNQTSQFDEGKTRYSLAENACGDVDCLSQPSHREIEKLEAEVPPSEICGRGYLGLETQVYDHPHDPNICYFMHMQNNDRTNF
jgi:hypothetical protein